MKTVVNHEVVICWNEREWASFVLRTWHSSRDLEVPRKPVRKGSNPTESEAMCNPITTLQVYHCDKRQWIAQDTWCAYNALFIHIREKLLKYVWKLASFVTATIGDVGGKFWSRAVCSESLAIVTYGLAISLGDSFLKAAGLKTRSKSKQYLLTRFILHLEVQKWDGSRSTSNLAVLTSFRDREVSHHQGFCVWS
jgi:hypothetical protein